MTQLTERDARDIFDTANTRDLDKIVDKFADDAIFQVPDQEKPFTGKEAIRSFLKDNYTAFPDWTMTAKSLAVSGNEVLVVDSVTGTHNGPLTGFGGKSIAPTHRKIALDEMTHIVVNEGGKIKSLRVYANPLSIPRQLGVSPESP